MRCSIISGAAETLAALAGEVGGGPIQPPAFSESGALEGPLTLQLVEQLMAPLPQENAIILQEAVSSGTDVERHIRHCAPHD